MSVWNTGQQAVDTVAATQSFNPQAGWLFAAIVAILVLASGVARLLKRRQRGLPNATIDNLTARINAWWVMTAVLLLAFGWGAWAPLCCFFWCRLPPCANFCRWWKAAVPTTAC